MAGTQFIKFISRKNEMDQNEMIKELETESLKKYFLVLNFLYKIFVIIFTYISYDQIKWWWEP